MTKRKLYRRSDIIAFNSFGYVFIAIVALLGILPFIMLISGSLTSERYIINHGYSIIPFEFSTAAYAAIFKQPQSIINSYGVTIFITVVGTVCSLFLTSMASYVLQRKDFEWRNVFSYFIYFTTLFNGGLTPWYILVKKMGMGNTLFALIIPNLFNVFHILIMRNYMRGIPHEITESAKVDGANDFIIFLRLILPISKPVLATIGLFTGLVYWNEWYNTMLFISNENLYPLQYYLYNMLNSAEAMRNLLQYAGAPVDSVSLPAESTKLAMTIVAAGPILLLYPFMQKYFVKGITIGAVKG